MSEASYAALTFAEKEQYAVLLWQQELLAVRPELADRLPLAAKSLGMLHSSAAKSRGGRVGDDPDRRDSSRTSYRREEAAGTLWAAFTWGDPDDILGYLEMDSDGNPVLFECGLDDIEGALYRDDFRNLKNHAALGAMLKLFFRRVTRNGGFHRGPRSYGRIVRDGERVCWYESLQTWKEILNEKRPSPALPTALPAKDSSGQDALATAA